MSPVSENQVGSLKTLLIPIDDAFVGILLSGIGKKPTNSDRFKSWGGEESQKCYWWQAITHHKITDETICYVHLFREGFGWPPY